MTEKPWNKLDVAPPYELVEVKDKDGRIGIAYPTFYLLNQKSESKKPIWDGGWCLQAVIFEENKLGNIVAWREIIEL